MTKDLIERLRDAELSLATYDAGHSSEYWLRHPEPASTLSTQSGETGLVGWVMVPREPTSTMTHAALDASRQSDTRLLPDCKEIWASEQVYRAMLSAAPPSPDPEQAPTRPSAQPDYRDNLARALFEAANGKNLIAWSDATRDFWLSRADQALAIPKASASDGSGDLVDPLEKLRALRRLCDASSQPFYVEIIDEVFAALSTPTARDQALEEAARVLDAEAKKERERALSAQTSTQAEKIERFARHLELAAAILRQAPALQPQSPSLMGSEGVELNGNRPLPFDRDQLGRMVREAWVRWAETQPTPKASWLKPYDDLTEADKEADRQIGEAVARWTLIGDAARLSRSTPSADDPVARQMAEALRNMIPLAAPHFTSAAETLALNESVNALSIFDGRAGR